MYKYILNVCVVCVAASDQRPQSDCLCTPSGAAVLVTPAASFIELEQRVHLLLHRARGGFFFNIQTIHTFLCISNAIDAKGSNENGKKSWICFFFVLPARLTVSNIYPFLCRRYTQFMESLRIGRFIQYWKIKCFVILSQICASTEMFWMNYMCEQTISV